MSSYTPGPWSILLDKDGDPQTLMGEVIVVNQQDIWIGEAFFDAESLNPVTNPLANARLIAAAPELLEALQDIAEGRNVPDDLLALDVHTFRSEWIALIQKRARAAIAKATNASP